MTHNPVMQRDGFHELSELLDADHACICRDEDCPSCGWPETYAEGTWSAGPTKVGCRKCGWSAPVIA